jgi:hypothetical protein
MSALAAEPLARGCGEGIRRYGLLVDTMRMRFVNDFCYAKFVPGAPDNTSGQPPRPIFMLLTRLHPGIRRRIAGARACSGSSARAWDSRRPPARSSATS